MTRFKFLTGDVNWQEYGGKWISQRLNNSEFDYWLVLEVLNMHEATGEEDQPKYNVSLSSVSPDQAGPDNLQSAFSCCGFDNEEMESDPIVQVECLHSYGVSTPVWQESGNNITKLMRQARREAQIVPSLYGFYMDRPVNRIGTNGWEAQAGNITAGLYRNIDDPTIKLMRKIEGIN